MLEVAEPQSTKHRIVTSLALRSTKYSSSTVEVRAGLKRMFFLPPLLAGEGFVQIGHGNESAILNDHVELDPDASS